MEIKIMLSIICFIIGYITWETIKYNKQKKEHERINQECARKGKTKKQKSSCSSKVSKPKTQNKRKYNSSKKKVKK